MDYCVTGVTDFRQAQIKKKARHLKELIKTACLTTAGDSSVSCVGKYISGSHAAYEHCHDGGTDCPYPHYLPADALT
ncbi:hypothetical protein AAHC03_09700 [Spirometra sp. Aus1]